MNGDVSLGKTTVNRSIKNFSEARGFLLVLHSDSGDSTTSALQLRPKPESSGLGVEANLYFHDKNFFPPCSNIIKQGVYVHVNIKE